MPYAYGLLGLGAGMLSPFDVQGTLAETRRCVKELGFGGVFHRPNAAEGLSRRSDPVL